MSKTQLRAATYSVKKLLDTSNIASYVTKYDTQIILNRSLKDLQTQGYVLNNIKSLKPKHITSLISLWSNQNKSTTTIKNYIAKLRLACRLLGKHDMIPKDNKSLNIENRSYSSNNKAIDANLSLVKDEYIKYSLKLQQLFGLRREEAIKFNASEADEGNCIRLKGSWTKGNVERIVPIKTPEQRQLVEEIKKLTKNSSLIPKGVRYKDQLNKYTSETRTAGIKNPHGLRHAYAQKRYRELTDQISKGQGWECPINGGITYNKMTKDQKIIDRQARLIISNHLGHSRIAIVKRYIG